jgi:S-adenosylmethionine decarboxylase
MMMTVITPVVEVDLFLGDINNMHEKENWLGNHIIADLYNVAPHYLTDLQLIKEVLHKAAQEAGATAISGNFHHFGENFGVTGVLLLKESHMSIHTWPELNFAAIDIFMCGNAKSKNAIDVIKDLMTPSAIHIKEVYRGDFQVLANITTEPIS